MAPIPTFLKSYTFSILLLISIVIGSILGVIFKEKAVFFKPFGDIFLNLLFTVVVPLVFFSISSAVAHMASAERLKRIFVWMIVIFIFTGVISSLVMMVGVKIYPPAPQGHLISGAQANEETVRISDQIVRAFTVSDFFEILSKKNMLALIVFSLLVGLASSAAGERARPVVNFLGAGSEVMIRVVYYIMLYAPIGLGAYFAYLVGVFGPKLFGSYARAMALYYPLALVYFFVGFSIYVYIAGGRKAIRIFWRNIVPASLTALGTGSSIATIPTNLEAAKRIGIPKDVREVVIPIGATIHMDGSCLSAILKIAFLFGVFQMDFSSPVTILTAVGVALLSGTVMSGIPGGGFLGEVLIVTMYNFPLEALPMISMIGTLVDPPATMVNATGDTVASMMVARILGGKGWMERG